MALVRLVDIARAANVSVSAVSKALADSPEIGAETKNRIREIAESMGYCSNTLARSLRLGKSNLLGVIVPNNDNPYYSSILQGISEKAREQGYTIIIANSNENAEDEIAAIRSLIAIPVAGILAVPVDLANYEGLQVHLVFLSRFPYRESSSPLSDRSLAHKFSYVVNDDFEGQRLAAACLLDRGIQKVYLLLDTNDPRNTSSFKTYIRLDGYKRALKDAGVPYDPSRVFFNINSIEACYETVLEICSRVSGDRIGICVINDYFSIGAISAINKCGLSIPDQVSIVGYDDVELAQYFLPPLTTVHAANKELGRYGTMHLFHLLNESCDTKQNVSTILSPYLKVRRS